MYYKTIYKSPIGKIYLVADETALIGAWFEEQKYFAEKVINEATDIDIIRIENNTDAAVIDVLGNKGQKGTASTEIITSEAQFNLSYRILMLAISWLDRYFAGENPPIPDIANPSEDMGCDSPCDFNSNDDKCSCPCGLSRNDDKCSYPCDFNSKNGEHSYPCSLKLAPQGTRFQKDVWKILREIPYGRTVTYGDIAKELAQKYGKERMSAQAVGGAVGHNPISVIVPCHRVVGAGGNLTGYAGGVDLKVRLLEHEGVDMSGFWYKDWGEL